jgi:hypothetical protein
MYYTEARSQKSCVEIAWDCSDIEKNTKILPKGGRDCGKTSWNGLEFD